jgi:hypothetical protein
MAKLVAQADAVQKLSLQADMALKAEHFAGAEFDASRSRERKFSHSVFFFHCAPTASIVAQG